MNGMKMKNKLKGKTRHGNNRIQQPGEWWLVKRITPTVNFPTKATGPWFRLEALDGSGDWRFVAATNDPNFEIIERDDN